MHVGTMEEMQALQILKIFLTNERETPDGSHLICSMTKHDQSHEDNSSGITHYEIKGRDRQH